MTQERTYYYSSDSAKKFPVKLTIETGYVTNMEYQDISAFIDPPQPLSKFINNSKLKGDELIINFFSKNASSAKGGKRSKKQRKSVRKLRRKTASRRK